MSTLSSKLAVICLITATSMVMYGCGGGGGSSDDPPEATDPMDGDDMTVTCDDGYMRDGNACVPTEETRAAIVAEARRIAGMIGPGADLADADTSTADLDDQVVSFGTGDTANTPVFVGDADLAADMRFAETDTAVAMVGDDWEGAEYSRTSADGMTVDTVVKYVNKEAPGPLPYSTYYGTAQSGVTGAHNAGVLTLETTVTDDTRGLINADFGITAAHQTIPYAAIADDPATTEVDESTMGHSVTGSFNGISGTFSCAAGSACPVASNAMGMLSSLTNWTFTPSAAVDMDGEALTGDDLAAALAALMVQGVDPDTDFMLFGYWMRAVTADDETTHTFLPLQDGTTSYGTTVAAVDGTATYSGPATGLYVTKTKTFDTETGEQTFTGSGQFTATAMLTATFGQSGSLAPNTLFTISGMINGFMDSDGEAIAGAEDWEVSLVRTTIGSPDSTYSTAGDGTAGDYLGTTSVGDDGTAGNYSGTFYGPSANDVQPSSTAGVFDAHFQNGHVRGAFGADKME